MVLQTAEDTPETPWTVRLPPKEVHGGEVLDLRKSDSRESELLSVSSRSSDDQDDKYSSKAVSKLWVQVSTSKERSWGVL